MKTHLLKKEHSGVLPYQRKAVVDTLNAISPQTLARTAEDVVLPPPTDPPIAVLQVQSNGLTCE